MINLFNIEVPYWWVQTVQVLQTHDTVKKHENTQNHVIGGYTRIEIILDTDKKHQEKYEAAANLIFN